MPMTAAGCGGGGADEERDAGAEDEAGEVVAAELVGAEQVVAGSAEPERGFEAEHEVLGEGVVRDEARAEDGDEEGEDQDDQAQEGREAADHAARSRGSSSAFSMSAPRVSAM